MALQNRKRSGGFTFVEVLATLTFAAIVLPVIMRGISTAAACASDSRRCSEATGLAQNLIAEFVAENNLQFSVTSGDFTPENTEYMWTAEINDWTEANLKELTVKVLWNARGREESVTLSTLFYTGTQ